VLAALHWQVLQASCFRNSNTQAVEPGLHAQCIDVPAGYRSLPASSSKSSTY
jgi:hypothetical protein